MEDPKSKQSMIVHSIIDKTDFTQQLALYEWGQELLAIRKSEQSVVQKAKHTIRATAQRKIIWPLVQRSMTQLKRHGWENRSWKVRLGMGAAAVTVVTLGGQGAGIAALGTAIGVPLWVVFGAGASFAGMLVDELESLIKSKQTSSSSQDFTHSDTELSVVLEPGEKELPLKNGDECSPTHYLTKQKLWQ